MEQGVNDVKIRLGEALVIVPGAVAARAYLEQFFPQHTVQLDTRTVAEDLRLVGKIGEPWPDQGGAYAGVMRGDEGLPDYHLILLADDEAQSVTWDKAKAWAASLRLDGKQDFTLPTRREQRLLFANLPEFFKPAAYWSCEQGAADSVFAWTQWFFNGNQFTWRKTDELRARAVRRLIIQ